MARFDLPTPAGLALVAAALLLSGPGVHAVRAEGPPPPAAAAPDAAPACNAGVPEDAPLVGPAQLVEELRREALAQPPTPGDDGAIVLNNRGFNYGPAPQPAPPPLAEPAR